MKVLIVYYSTYGNTYKMALEIAEGVREAGAIPVIRRVPELIPDEIIESREDMKKGREMQKDVPFVAPEDFKEAGAIAFGTPTRFGVVSAQLKNQVDRLTSLWIEGVLEGKPAGIFVSTATPHGGQEMTIFSLLPALLHLGMIFVGVPYSVKELFFTRGGGSPYGPGHIAGTDNSREIDPEEKAILRAFGKRLAEIGIKLQKSEGGLEMSKKEKKEVKVFFDQDSLAALFDQIARDIKSGYMTVGDLKIDIPGNVEAEIEYKEKEEDGKIKCVMEWELKWYK